MFTEMDRAADIFVVSTGSLDGGLSDEVLKPKVEYFCKNKRTWMGGIEGAERQDTL